MTTRRRVIEKRLFDAVMVVLAGSGCYTSAPPATGNTYASPPQEEKQRRPREDRDARDPWSEPPPNDSSQQTSQQTQPYTPPVSPPLAQAQQVCSTYKQTKLDPKKVPAVPKTVPGQQPIGEMSNWDAGLNAARCVIVRENRTGDVSSTYEPRCCPSPGPQQHACPGPQTTTSPGPVLLVEHASVAQDGTVLASNLRWIGIEPYREPQPYCGRLPEGALALGERDGGRHAMAYHLAAMAELEAASVPAFERLARELEAHGAPAALVQRTYAAMRDEVRHERMMRTLAVHHGAQPRAVAVGDLPCRSLEAIGHENAVEGRVREAFGALVATYQAERAPVELRATFRAIARDERRHAALAEDVHAWIVQQLDEDAAHAIEAARQAAVAELYESLSAMRTSDELGMPSAEHAHALFDAYFA